MSIFFIEPIIDNSITDSNSSLTIENINIHNSNIQGKYGFILRVNEDGTFGKKYLFRAAYQYFDGSIYNALLYTDDNGDDWSVSSNSSNINYDRSVLPGIDGYIWRRYKKNGSIVKRYIFKDVRNSLEDDTTYDVMMFQDDFGEDWTITTSDSVHFDEYV